MDLTDKEILELNDLCNGLVDGTLSESQNGRLTRWLEASEAARRYYVRAMGLSASLYSYASEMQVEASDVAAAGGKVLRPGWWWVPLAAAACVVLGLWIAFRPGRREPEPVAWKADEYVARMTGSKDCQWANVGGWVRPGDFLRKGQQLELAAGFAEITFDSGAQVVLEGPAVLDLTSAWDTTLRRGTLKASVPPEALGFRISNPAVEVVDLGTEFTMIADGAGAADVLVLKGTVEASARDASTARTIVLHEKQSRHFAPSGISNVSDPEGKFARFARPVALDPFLPATDYVHWSFDEAGGPLLKADSFGGPLNAYDARLEEVSDAVLETVRPEGRWQRALRFNGHLYAATAFPGISGNSPRTVVFWVRVPEDARLSSAYAMVAWGANSRKLGSHPIHIGWNRNPSEGAVGVLRTDYGRGFALGTTPLRDGRWHHVAIVFVPGEDEDTPVEVKQYVDGRFEGEGRPSPPGTAIAEKFSDPDATTIKDMLWLGCRLGANGPRRDRFRGELDELAIANRSLAPREIVELMKANQPLRFDVAAAPK